MNQDIHTASIRASLGLSIRFPSASLCWMSGIVLRVIPTVDITTKAIEMQEMTLAAMEVCGFSMRSHRQIWYLTNRPLPKSSST